MPPVVTEDVEYGGAPRRTQGSKRSPVSVHSGRVAQIRVLDRGHVRRHHPADVAGRNVVQPFHELFPGAVAPQVQLGACQEIGLPGRGGVRGEILETEAVDEARQDEEVELPCPQLFDLLGDVARHPAYAKSEVALARSNFASEIEEERSTPDFVAEEQLDKAIFGRHPYAFVVPEPTEIEKVTPEQLKAFAGARYVPNNAHLIIVGDFDPAAVYDQAQKAFGSWERRPLAAEATSLPTRRDKRQIYFVDRPSSVQSTIAIGALAMPRQSPDYMSLRTAHMIYGGAFYSRLTLNIREAKGYTYSPYSQVNLRRRSGSFSANAAVRNEVTGPTILEMLYELDRMRVAPVTKEELDAAKTYSIGGLSLELESQAGMASRINSIYTYDLARDFLQMFQTRLDALTPDDIQKAAAKYFDTYRGAIVVVGDYGQVKDQIAPFGDVVVVKH